VHREVCLQGTEARLICPNIFGATYINSFRHGIDFGRVCPQKIPDVVQLSRTVPRGRLKYYRRLVTYLGNQDEDCLNLNLYAPMIHTTTGKHWRHSYTLLT